MASHWSKHKWKKLNLDAQQQPQVCVKLAKFVKIGTLAGFWVRPDWVWASFFGFNFNAKNHPKFSSSSKPFLRFITWHALSWKSSSWQQDISSSCCCTCSTNYSTLWKVQCIALEFYILWERWFSLSLLQIHFLFLGHFHMNLKVQNSWTYWSSTLSSQFSDHQLTNHELTVCNYHWQRSTKLNKSQDELDDPTCSSSYYLLLSPPLHDSIAY